MTKGTEIKLSQIQGYDPDAIPASPNIYDDEFTGTSLAAAWTVVENTADSVSYSTVWPSWIRLYFNGNKAFEIRKTAVGVTSVTAKFSISPQSNYLGAKIGLFDDDFSDGVMAVFEYETRVKMQLGTRDSNTFNWSRINLYFGVDGRPIPFSKVYLHLQRNTNDWFSAVSFDGMSFYRLATAYSKTFTVNQTYIRLAQEGATVPVYCGADWIRFNWVTL